MPGGVQVPLAVVVHPTTTHDHHVLSLNGLQTQNPRSQHPPARPVTHPLFPLIALSVLRIHPSHPTHRPHSTIQHYHLFSLHSIDSFQPSPLHLHSRTLHPLHLHHLLLALNVASNKLQHTYDLLSSQIPPKILLTTTVWSIPQHQSGLMTSQPRPPQLRTRH